jgi:hypothetical protein
MELLPGFSTIPFQYAAKLRLNYYLSRHGVLLLTIAVSGNEISDCIQGSKDVSAV